MQLKVLSVGSPHTCTEPESAPNCQPQFSQTRPFHPTPTLFNRLTIDLAPLTALSKSSRLHLQPHWGEQNVFPRSTGQLSSSSGMSKTSRNLDNSILAAITKTPPARDSPRWTVPSQPKTVSCLP